MASFKHLDVADFLILTHFETHPIAPPKYNCLVEQRWRLFIDAGECKQDYYLQVNSHIKSQTFLWCFALFWG